MLSNFTFHWGHHIGIGLGRTRRGHSGMRGGTSRCPHAYWIGQEDLHMVLSYPFLTFTSPLHHSLLSLVAMDPHYTLWRRSSFYLLFVPLHLGLSAHLWTPR